MNFKSMGWDDKDGTGSSGLLPLARQSSVYSLTFDEFQNTPGGIGKDFGSMNMEEFLKNVWTAEETQAMASVAAMGAAEGGTPPANGIAALQTQGSLTLPRTLSQKTVDEVWRNAFREGSFGYGGGGQGAAPSNMHPQQRQPTLGEVTLEEFLVKAGVVREDLTQSGSRPIINSVNTNNNTTTTRNNTGVFYGDMSGSNLNSNTSHAFGFPPTGRSNGSIAPNSIPNNSSATSLETGVNSLRPLMQLGNTTELANQQGMRGEEIMGIGDPGVNGGLMPGMVGLGVGGVTVATAGSPVNHFSSDRLGKSNGDLSSLSPIPYVFNGGQRGRRCSGAVEKVVERRQRRMIKNRESAARSRARKQAYTMELEGEIAKLKEQNQELEKKQAKVLEVQKNQVLELINRQCDSKKRCLRRAQTGPW